MTKPGTLRVHFYGGGHDWLSRIMSFGARLTSRTARFTHVSVSIPGIDTEDYTFGYELGGANWGNHPDDRWWLSYDYIDIETPGITDDELMNRLWGMRHNSRGTTWRGLLSLMFDWPRTDRAFICTDVVWVVSGILPEDASMLTPDEMYRTLKYPPIAE